MSRLTMTFDNGPTPGVTEHVLDVLAERGISATFFVVGRDLGKPGRRELAQRAADAGHWHGNHTMTHSIQLGDGDGRLAESEIGDSQRVLGDLARPEQYFRPWGDGRISDRILSRAAIDYLCAGGYTLALWNCVPRDWEDPVGWVDRALAALDRQDWTLLVLHDQDTGAMSSLERFLDLALARGTQIVQELPPMCTPIRNGRIVGPIEHLYRPTPAADRAPAETRAKEER
ncbi:MAG TPA: polysaccharide deacetylase family protein [Cellulomonas sp.]